MLLPKDYQNKKCLALVSFGAGQVDGAAGGLKSGIDRMRIIRYNGHTNEARGVF